MRWAHCSDATVLRGKNYSQAHAVVEVKDLVHLLHRNLGEGAQMQTL